MTTFSVIVASFGKQSWADLAHRAFLSVLDQTVRPVDAIKYHGRSLHAARNGPVKGSSGEWLVFLDADDRLDPGYVEAMTKAAVALPDGDFLLQPATLGVHPDGRLDPYPVLIKPKRSIMDGNWMVVGTAIRRAQFLRLGGFADLPAWEDWHLWIRAMLDDARPVQVPDAVYQVSVRAGSRNELEPRVAQKLYEQIRCELLPLARQKGLA